MVPSSTSTAFQPFAARASTEWTPSFRSTPRHALSAVTARSVSRRITDMAKARKSRSRRRVIVAPTPRRSSARFWSVGWRRIALGSRGGAHQAVAWHQEVAPHGAHDEAQEGDRKLLRQPARRGDGVAEGLGEKADAGRHRQPDQDDLVRGVFGSVDQREQWATEERTR